MVSYRAAVVALAVFLPNFAFASKVNRRFENTTELKSAVDQYNDDACISSADGSGCVVGQTYGWPMNTWNVSDITDMRDVFYNHSKQITFFFNENSFNEDISDWVVSKVTDMRRMFFHANSFNGDLSKWEVSKVTSMWGMFDGASSFNRDLSDWNVSKVTDMDYMFFGASSFNQDLCAWNDKFTPHHTREMFEYSGCMFQDAPVKLEGGPWCASSCQGDENDGVVTVAPTTTATGTPTAAATTVSNSGVVTVAPTTTATGTPTSAATTVTNSGVSTVTPNTAIMAIAATLIFVQNVL
mmetsp:Transcript_19411/g.36240  ORF Transcript_19411/g.36240 Transcript_19411/m.36240 type:complete len:297 (-) Transcript_19411:430-1320(-)